MALQVWLPLTKDLRNQGLSDITVTNNGATFNSAGKLGGCYSFNGSSQKIVNTLPSTITSPVGSLSCWVKMNSLPGSSSFYNLMQLGNLGGYATCRLGLYMEYTNKINISIDGSSTGANVYTHSLVANQWYHICATYDGTIVKLYIDGNEVLSKTASKGSYTTAASYLYVGGTSSYYLNGYMNDARYYDHCLSEKEVKELSKGLVLHYPLNRQGFGQENLMPNSIEMPVGSANPSTGTWRLAGSSQMTRSRVTISDAPSGASTYGFQSVGLQTGQDASCWGIDSFPRESGVTYTLSAWGRIVGGSSTAAMLGFSVYNGTTLDYGGVYGQAKSSDVEYYGSGAYDYAGGKLNPNGNWTRIYRTFTSTATSGNIYIGFNTAKTGNSVTLQMCGVKLEKGDKTTPWIPNSNESMYTTLGLNGTTEYDCSGFGNNGTRVGTFFYNSNTPKYHVSTQYNGTDNTLKIPFDASVWPDNFTMSIWFRKDELGSKSYETLFGGPSGFEMDTRSGAATTLSLYMASVRGGNVYTGFEFGKWYMVTLVNDGVNELYYINGDLVKTIEKKSMPVGTYYIGSWQTANKQNYMGLLSDARIYATALSASDIKSLYQNCATIDADGTIHGQIRS